MILIEWKHILNTELSKNDVNECLYIDSDAAPIVNDEFLDREIINMGLHPEQRQNRDDDEKKVYC